MQIKTIVTHHLRPVRMAPSERQQIAPVSKDGEEGGTWALLVGMQSGAATTEKVSRFLRKLKITLLYDPVIPFVGTYPEKKRTNLKRYMHPYAHCSIIYNSQDTEAT